MFRKLCVSGLLLFTVTSSYAEPAILWLQADLRPYYIDSGPHQGQGAMERAQQLLTEALPQYQHKKQWLSLVRRQQLLLEAPANVCSFGMIKTVERQTLKFSRPMAVGTGYAVIMLADGKLVKRWQQASTDLLSWLPRRDDVVGLMEAGRAIPDFARDLSDNRLLKLPIQTNPIALLAKQRADYLLEYPSRAMYLKKVSGITNLKLQYHFLDDKEANLSYVACSAATSDQLIVEIDAAISKVLPQQAYRDALFSWQDPATMSQLTKMYDKYLLQPLNPESAGK